MSGIVFHKTREIDRLRRFYTEESWMSVWLEQADCVILEHGDFLVGFCRREEADREGLLTFVYRTREEVDAIHTRIAGLAKAPPAPNPTYRIYHFFAADPEGRTLEFQSFDPPVVPHLSATELLRTRRSIRRFTEVDVHDDLIREVIDECACAPSSRNSQPWTFVTIREGSRRDRLAALRGESSAPIARAPAAIAVCSDPTLTGRPLEDGCVAGTYLLLAAWNRGLGTCWIGGMDRDDAKEILGVPVAWTVAMITPIGWPARIPAPPERLPVRRGP